MGLRIQVHVQAGARTPGVSRACVQERDILTGVQERDTLSCVQERDILACVKERDVLAGVQERDILTGNPGGCAQINSIIIDYREQSVLIEWVVWV